MNDPEQLATEIKAIGDQLIDLLHRHLKQPKDLKMSDCSIDGRGEEHEREVRITITLSREADVRGKYLIAHLEKTMPEAVIYKGQIKKPS